MSKRMMEHQGGADRYGGGRDEEPDDKPRPATQAQLARRKILETKGRKTPRGGSRAGSPAVVTAQGAGQANPFQSFQPPPTASSFSFNVPGATPAPNFGPIAPQQNGGMAFGGNQANGTSSFGGFGNNQQQSNGANSFGSTFGSNNTQPQTNGFGGLGGGATQPNNASTPASSFNFGQTPAQSQEQPKQNGFNPSTTSAFDGFGGAQSQPAQARAQETPKSNPFAGLFTSQTQAQPQTNGEHAAKPNSFANFGGSQARSSGNTSAPNTGLFGSTLGSAAPSTSGQSVFSGLSAPSASTVKLGMFSQSQVPQDDDEPSQTSTPQPAFSGFGVPPQTNGQTPAQPNGEKPKSPVRFSFGQTSQQADVATPKPNPFANAFGQPKAPETEKPAALQQFQVNGDSGATASTSSNPFAGAFGQLPQAQPDTAKKAPTVTGSDLFSGASQQKPPNTPFKFTSSQAHTEKTPTQNIFGAAQAQTNGAPTYTSGPFQQEDTSMMTPGSTPYKGNLAAAASEQEQAPESDTPANANAGKSMFDRISYPATTTPGPPPTFAAFGGPSAAPAEETADSNAGKSIFDRMTPRDVAPPATAPKPFAAPTFSLTAPTPAASERPSAPKQRPAASTENASGDADASEQQKLRQLNEALMVHLRSEDPNKDWSIIFQYCIEQAAKITGTEPPAAPNFTASAVPTGPASSVFVPSAPLRTPSAPPPTPAVTGVGQNLFAGAQTNSTQWSRGSRLSQPGAMHAVAPPPPGQSSRAPAPATPQSTAKNVFAQAVAPPATAPVNRKRSADEDLAKHSSFAPATEKRSKPNSSVEYPKLPESASKTAQLFASTLDKPTNSAPLSLGPSNDLMSKVREQKAAREAAQNNDAAGKAAAPSSAFKPSTKFNFGQAEPATEPQQPGETVKAQTFQPSAAFNLPAADKPQVPSSFGFKPALPAQATAAPPSAPSFGFKPAAAPVGGSGFLSTFGKQAEASVEAAKRKRMDEDYDSDDEDKATWEARDRAEQEAKRQKIDELAKKAPTFAPTGSAPKAGLTFKVSGPAAPANFISTFGKKADASAEEAKRKRMDEDYDSDDEDKATWEARDRAEQEAKRQKIDELAKKAPTFTPTFAAGGSAPKAGFAFALPGSAAPAKKSPLGTAEQSTDEAGPPADSNAGKSMFERISSPVKAAPTPSLFSTLTPSQGATTSSFFSQTAPTFKFGAPRPATNAEKDKARPEKEQGQGDKSWTPSTPIKFGGPAIESTTPATAPPAKTFGGLFGPVATASTTGKLAPPAMGFAFGAPKVVSADVSRATTPGVTTDGEGGEGGDAEAGEPAAERQVEDMTAIMPEERETEDVLFEIGIAKAMKNERRDAESGGSTLSWVEKGKGPLYIFRSKATGKTRVVMKIPPLGRPAMNFSPMKGFAYAWGGKKTLTGTFFDHLAKGEEGRPSTWSIQVREASDAQEIARLLEENKD
ncbi:hypothetical protein LTR53_001732 [Teratosphaeriaceae sp. CCFEE 6253]|nr:hypothetical protein LTR53_001732 [Teratosphaeriaceae sp. CCFEE 6253]